MYHSGEINHNRIYLKLKDDLIIELPYGKIQGHIRKSFDGNEYYGFQEIPYASPPVGPNRFKEPKSPDPWDGVLNTTKNTKQCIQEPFKIFPLDPLLKQTEDCLYINVYSPQKPGANVSLPVYVYIHGGAFVLGSGAPDVYGPGRFLDYDIIVVTFNYRLGALGFLTTGDGVIPANLGLKDQRFALKWVNSNIHLFGGDPEKVTIGGESAGAISVGFQLLGENTEGLFRAAIQQSGTSIGQMTISLKAKINAFNLGKALDENFSSEQSEDLLEILMNVPAENITQASKILTPADSNSAGYVTRLKWIPVIESEIDENPFIKLPMHESYMSGKFHKVPVLLGFNSEEALTFLDENYDYLAEDYDKDPSLLVTEEYNIPEENRTLVGEKLKQIYTNTLFEEDKAALVKYSSDSGFTTSMLRQAELSAQYNVPAYFYRFSYMGTLGALIAFNRHSVPGAEGVQHAEELVYMWDIVPPFLHLDTLTMRRLLIMWTNFIKYLNPTPVEDEMLNNVIWPSVQNGEIQFLNINETLEIESHPRYYSKIRDLLLEYIQPPFLVF